MLFDPMDGSSNIDVNGTLGTIFSIRHRGEDEDGGLLKSGWAQVSAGYILFGPAVLFVYADGEAVRLFTLDPSIGEFLLTTESVRMPQRGRALCRQRGPRAIAGRPEVRAFVEHLKESDAATGRPYATRYSASLVGDVHRILLEGGIYLYPADSAADGKPKGKLRLLYECAPLALVVERAGGAATTGREAVLDVVPEDPARAHPDRDREPDRGGAVREIRAGVSVGAGLVPARHAGRPQGPALPPPAPPYRPAAAALRSISSGDTSSTCVDIHQWFPHGSSTPALRSP